MTSNSNNTRAIGVILTNRYDTGHTMSAVLVDGRYADQRYSAFSTWRDVADAIAAGAAHGTFVAGPNTWDWRTAEIAEVHQWQPFRGASAETWAVTTDGQRIGSVPTRPTRRERMEARLRITSY